LARLLAGIAAGFLVCAGGTSVSAQTVSNPRIIQFSPSSDHGSTLSDGRPEVSRYELRLYNVGASQPFQTHNLGKPSPGSDGLIRIDLAATVTPWPLNAGSTYEARVAAIGPEGTGQSSPSNPFSFSAPCGYTVSTTSLTVPASGGGRSVTVSTTNGCTWAVRSNAPWIAVTSGNSGTTGGAVAFAVAANLSSSSRVGTLTVAGRAVTVTQSGAPPLNVTSLRANVVFPSSAGKLVTWTATASGGVGPYTYEFWLFNGTTWRIARGWSASNSWTWQPATPGTYAVQVWARNAGSTKAYDAYRAGSASISKTGVLTVTGVQPSVTRASAGQAVTWTVTTAGGTGPYAYQFWIFDGTQWSLGRDWSTSNAWEWSAPTPGTFNFQVWVRNAGSEARLDAYRSFGPFTAGRPDSLTATALTPDRSAPVATGTPIKWTARASGGTAPYTYQFSIFDGSSWSVGRDWSTTPTWTWIPSTAGTYAAQVLVRNAGSSSGYDSSREVDGYTVESPTPLHVTELVSDRRFPVPRGTPVTWMASAVGGSGPYTYKFYVYDGVTWSVGRDWSTSRTWTWLPDNPGTYVFQVWVRNADSSADYDGWLNVGPVSISAAAPLAVTGVTTMPGTPLVAGAPALVTATAAGGNGPYSYQFWVFDGSTWSVGRDWSGSNSFVWTPDAPGTYAIQVWVRNAGSTRPWDAWTHFAPISVIP